MKQRISILFVLCISTVSSTIAKDPVNFPDLKGWDLKISGDVYTPENLWDLINGAAESYLAYDFIDLHLADYTNKAGMTIHAEVYRHSSLNNAFGIYTSERSPGYDFIDLGGQAYLDEGVLNCFTGPYYLKLYSTDEDETVQAGLKTVGEALVKVLGHGSIMPDLVSVFPETDKLANTDQYIGQNFIGFEFLHSAFTAEYIEGYRLFIIEGENEDEILAMLRSYLEFTGQDINPSTQSAFVIQDRYNGSIPVIHSGRYLLGILDVPGNRNARIGLAEMDRTIRSMQ